MMLSEGTEIPSMFALWCGLSGISAALGRSVFINMGTYHIYPNMFVVLVAGSGRCRKSTSIGQVEKLLSQMTPKANLIAQKITPEALIVALRNGQTDTEAGVVNLSNEGYVVVDELSVFLNKKSYEMGLAALMISMYDCKDDLSYHTRGRGEEKISNCCLGMLGGSTIEWIKEGIPSEAIGGGLTSRMLFVYEKHPPPPQAWTIARPEHDIIKQELVFSLNGMMKLKGQMEFSPEAKEFYIKTYNEFYNSSPFFHNRYLSGYASRRHIHMIKLAMLFAIAESQEMVINGGHLDKSLELLEQSEKNMVEVIGLITSTEGGSKLDMVLDLVRGKGDIARSQLQRHFQRQLGYRELDDIVLTLVRSGHLTFETRGKEAFLRYKR